MKPRTVVMGGMKEQLKLAENIAAVHMGGHPGVHITGVVVVIPLGAVITFDRTEAPVDQMLRIEWNGSSYGVFGADLLKRANRVMATREHNPGIIPIHAT